MIIAQNEYEKIVKAMADKGVPHLFFELLADLRKNEIDNSKAIDGIEFAVVTALDGCKDFENNDAHEGNYLQVIRKLVSDYKRALDEIAERHSKEEVEVGVGCRYSYEDLQNICIYLAGKALSLERGNASLRAEIKNKKKVI